MLSIWNTTSLTDSILQCIRVHFWFILMFVLCAYSCLNTFYSCYIIHFNIFTLKSNKYTCICLWHLTTFPFCSPLCSSVVFSTLICITDFMHPVYLPFLQSLTQWQLFFYKNSCWLVIPWHLYIKVLILCDPELWSQEERRHRPLHLYPLQWDSGLRKLVERTVLETQNQKGNKVFGRGIIR